MKSQTNRLLCSLALLCCCSPAQAALADISRIFHQTPSLSQFEICQGGGCAIFFSTSLSENEWKDIARIFNQPTNSSQQEGAERERQKIAQAIGLLEELVGKKVGTATDLAGTFNNSETPGQMDCNDEAINTTTYLRLLKQNGLIPLHEIEDTRTRNFFFTGWPHSTAVIHDINTAERYAVDSWFYDNGHAATIVPFKTWKANYKPEDSPIGKRIDKLKHAQSQ